jgi:hypothetical protein
VPVGFQPTQNLIGRSISCGRAVTWTIALVFFSAGTSFGQTGSQTSTQASAQSATSKLAQAQVQSQNWPILKRRTDSRAQIPGADAPDPLAVLGDVSTTLPPPILLVVAKGVPLRIALKKPLPIRHAGVPVKAFVSEPVYAFDRVVIPAASEVDGRITEVAPPSKWKRTRAYLDADFSPHRVLRFQFDTLILKDGTRLPLDTKVLPTLGPVLHLETKANGKNSAVHRAKGLIRKQWDMAKAMLKPSAIWHLVKTFAYNEFPYHKQKLPAGTAFDIELEQPLEFGMAVVAPSETGEMGQLPSENSNAFARLTTRLSSATAHAGMPVEAILTRPVFSHEGKLLLPVGTSLKGIVVRAKPARRLHRNGQLHFTLQRVQLPQGVSKEIEMALEGIEVPKSSHIEVDSEGETHVAGNKEARVLTTALSVMIATSNLENDREHGGVDANGDPGKRGIAGGSGYKLVGAIVGFAVKSPNFARVMGFWGAGQSVYGHFIARGTDLVLPKDTPIEVSFGRPHVPRYASARPAVTESAGDP